MLASLIHSEVFGPEGDKLHHNLNPFCHSAMLGASHQPLHLPEGEKLETRGDITIYSRLGCESSLQYKGLRGDNCCYQDTFLVQARSRAFLRGTSLETRFDWICSWLSILSLQGWAWGGKVASQVWKHSSQNSRSQHLSPLLSHKVIDYCYFMPDYLISISEPCCSKRKDNFCALVWSCLWPKPCPPRS